MVVQFRSARGRGLVVHPQAVRSDRLTQSIRRPQARRTTPPRTHARPSTAGRPVRREHLPYDVSAQDQQLRPVHRTSPWVERLGRSPQDPRRATQGRPLEPVHPGAARRRPRSPDHRTGTEVLIPPAQPPHGPSTVSGDGLSHETSQARYSNGCSPSCNRGVRPRNRSFRLPCQRTWSLFGPMPLVLVGVPSGANEWWKVKACAAEPWSWRCSSLETPSCQVGITPSETHQNT